MQHIMSMLLLILVGFAAVATAYPRVSGYIDAIPLTQNLTVNPDSIPIASNNFIDLEAPKEEIILTHDVLHQYDDNLYLNSPYILHDDPLFAPNLTYNSEELEPSNYMRSPNETVTTQNFTDVTNISTTPSPAAHLSSSNGTMSEEEELIAITRTLAIQHVLNKVLKALGPKFEESLPVVPTNVSLTAPDTNIRMVTYNSCPRMYYSSCSSRTLYPSCETPPNTDPNLWAQRFNLFFNITSHFSSQPRNIIINATLRLYKAERMPFDAPKPIIVRLNAFSNSLSREAESSNPTASTVVMSDYIGWIFMDVKDYAKSIIRQNYGAKITVEAEEDNVPWNIPTLFERMDCQPSDAYINPLPFELQLEGGNAIPRYPALNIRIGTIRREPHYRRRHRHHSRRRNRMRHHQRSNSPYNQHHQRRYHQADEYVQPRQHLGDNRPNDTRSDTSGNRRHHQADEYPQSHHNTADNRQNDTRPDTLNNNSNRSNYYDDTVDDYPNGSDNNHGNQASRNIWSTNEARYFRPARYQAVSRHRPRYKKELPILSTEHDNANNDYNCDQENNINTDGSSDINSHHNHNRQTPNRIDHRSEHSHTHNHRHQNRRHRRDRHHHHPHTTTTTTSTTTQSNLNVS